MAELATDNEWLHTRILGEIMGVLRKPKYDLTPAELISELFERAKHMLSVSDPYEERKWVYQEEVLAAEPQFRERIKSAEKPLALTVRLACMANLFDDELLRDLEISELFDRAGEMPLHTEVWSDFCADIKRAGKILFVHDAAGEVVLDKLLLERWKGKELVSVLRSNPVLCWATDAEGREAGLDKAAQEIIFPGIDGSGIQLNQCSEEFQQHFEKADLVIVKGQGNYETLEGENKPIYAMFRIKCWVLAERLGLKPGDLVLEKC